MTVRTMSKLHPTTGSARLSRQGGATPWCAVIVLAAAAVGIALAGYVAVQLWHLVA